MITFGGRPLNTYKFKGGSNEPHVVEVNSNLVTINGPELFDPKNNSVVDVNSKLVTIDPPGFFDQPNKPPKINSDINGPINGGSSQELLKLNKDIEKVKFNNRLVVKLFGKEIVLTVEFLIWAAGILWSLLIFTVIFSICYFLYDITQGILNAGHSLLDAVSDGLTTVNDAAINFGFIGFPNANFRLFGNVFAPWISDVDRSNNSFPRDAKELVINVLTEMIQGIVDSLPGILEGIGDGLEKLGDAF